MSMEFEYDDSWNYLTWEIRNIRQVCEQIGMSGKNKYGTSALGVFLNLYWSDNRDANKRQNRSWQELEQDARVFWNAQKDDFTG